MSNQQSDARLEDSSSPELRGTRTIANSDIRGDNSGNSGFNNNTNSGNTNITFNRDYGDTDSSKHHAEILQCLYASKYEEHRGRVCEPAEGTCTWVTEHSKYRDWLEKKASGLLWLSADPGCGKSVIASFLVKHLESRTDAVVCYFFFKDDSDEQRCATFALCAILHQLFPRKASLSVFAREAFQAKGKGFTQEVDALWNILVRAVAEGGCGKVICVVDALDECEKGTLTRLIHHVTRLPGSRSPDIPLKFLVTSRPYHSVERELGSPATVIRLKGEDEVKAITADVTRAIDVGIRDLESYWGRHGGLGYLRNLLEASADRTFLWVSLVLEILKNSEDDSQEVFTNIVSTAPPNITGLYTKILDRSADRDKARRILNIVVAAARPLTLREMNIAFRIRREHKAIKDIGDLTGGFDKTVKNSCGLFVRVIDSKIYLVHQTAREFLLRGASPGLGNWQYTLCPEDSNFVLADICISYLSLKDFENDPFVADDYGYSARGNLDKYLQKYGFLGYAARNWANHFRDSRDQQMRLFEFTRKICTAPSKRFLTWFQVHWFTSGQSHQCPRDFTHLMIASWLGQGAVVKRLLEEGRDMDARSERYGTALNIAALRREKDIARMLVDKGVAAYICEKMYYIFHTERYELWFATIIEEEEFRVARQRQETFVSRDFFIERLNCIKFLKHFCIQDTLDLRRVRTPPSWSTDLP